MRTISAASVMVLALGLSPVALATPSGLVQPNGRLELDFGFGLAHRDPPDVTGMGFNIEGKYGLGGGTEFGFRTAVRSDDGRGTGADVYARPFDRETFGTGGDTFANPELRLRQLVTSALALEARVYVPFDGPFGFMLAAPLQLSGGNLRFDSGVYVPIIFADPSTLSWVSIPAQLWFYAGSAWHIGLLSGARLSNPGGDWSVPVGVGLDRTLSQAADLVMWFLFPDITQDSAAKQFGAGVGLRIRI
ncbi:MAG: hypothetical protein SF187_20700 [Deltaproteobacteria bacterium]|nr:hypothetical protein [Deltaproteobacteria bacterium]